MAQDTITHEHVGAASKTLQSSYGKLVEKLNTKWHERGLQIFMVIVLAHWAEHLAQAYQVYVLDWPVPESRGALGLYFPILISSEILHYGYAIIMVVALWVFRTGFTGKAYTWWMVSFWIQFWHHIEHALLQGQAIVGENLFNSPVPISIVQVWIPRVELHLLYNTLVFIPMVVAMYLHMFPPAGEVKHIKCSCVIKPKSKAA